MTSANDRPIPRPTDRPISIGCVSFLNARPLIEDLEPADDLTIHYQVPSALLPELIAGRTDIALCPVIDFQLSPIDLQLVPVGGICCDGPTHTVRLFSRVPMDRVTDLHIDPDSHTSVILSQIILRQSYQVAPTCHPLSDTAPNEIETLLLIGDKVVTDAPSNDDFPYQLDLGIGWQDLTGLPFVFATWMTPAGTDLKNMPQRLTDQRQLNHKRIETIVDRHAAPHGWPAKLAHRYLRHWLHYQLTDRHFEAIDLFWRYAHDLALVDRYRPLDCYPNCPPSS